MTHNTDHRLDCAVMAMRHRIAAVVFDAMSESGATEVGIAKASGATRAIVRNVLRANDGPTLHDIVRISLAVGIRLSVSMIPRVIPTMRRDVDPKP